MRFYSNFMNKHLFSRINIDPSRTNVPDGTEPDPEKESKRYEALIQELGGIDIQLLGIGHDGHIGFNEPNSFFDKETHCVDLTEMTIEANKRFFESIDDVPRQAYTMGIGTIMSAKKILMVVTGADNADIVAKAFIHCLRCTKIKKEETVWITMQFLQKATSYVQRTP